MKPDTDKEWTKVIKFEADRDSEDQKEIERIEDLMKN